jgi:hypothetical protein
MAGTGVERVLYMLFLAVKTRSYARNTSLRKRCVAVVHPAFGYDNNTSLGGSL